MNAHEFELSHELELELEGESHELHELEHEFEGESHELHELELEFEGESHEAGLGELEAHELHEHEQEAEQFFGGLAKLAARGLASPALRKIALNAARTVLRPGGGLFEHEGEFELQGELEGELEFELEGEFELNPVRRVYLDAMMEHMAQEAAEAETEQEAAEAFLPLIPLAMKALPIAGKLAAKFGPKLFKAAMPHLKRGVGRLGKALFRSPTGKKLMRAVPQVLKGTASQLLRRYAAGRPITGRTALRALAGNTARVLGSPRHLSHAWRHGRKLVRRYPSVRTRRWRWVNGRRTPIHQRALPPHVSHGHGHSHAPHGHGHGHAPHGHSHAPHVHGHGHAPHGHAPHGHGPAPHANGHAHAGPAPISYTTPAGQVCTCTPAYVAPPAPVVGCAECGL
jgi:hypothetical protein